MLRESMTLVGWTKWADRRYGQNMRWGRECCYVVKNGPHSKFGMKGRLPAPQRRLRRNRCDSFVNYGLNYGLSYGLDYFFFAGAAGGPMFGSGIALTIASRWIFHEPSACLRQ
jgi:hypothetical protein